MLRETGMKFKQLKKGLSGKFRQKFSLLKENEHKKQKKTSKIDAGACGV